MNSSHTFCAWHYRASISQIQSACFIYLFIFTFPCVTWKWGRWSLCSFSASLVESSRVESSGQLSDGDESFQKKKWRQVVIRCPVCYGMWQISWRVVSYFHLTLFALMPKYLTHFPEIKTGSWSYLCDLPQHPRHHRVWNRRRQILGWWHPESDTQWMVGF